MLNKVSRGQNRLLGGWSTNRKLCGWLSQNHLHATPPSLGSMNAGRKSGCTSIRRPTGSPRLAHNSVRAASATSWRPTPPAPTGRPQKLLYSFFSSVASSDDDPACRNSNPDSGKTRCVACRYSQTPPLTFELPRGCVAWRLTTCLLRSSSYFNTRHSSANRYVGQTLTHSSDNPNTAEVTSARNL